MPASLDQRLGWAAAHENLMSSADAAQFVNSICTAEYDFREVMQALDRMKPSRLKSAFRKVFRQAATKMRNPVRDAVKTKFPGNVTDPRNPNRKHGAWRKDKNGNPKMYGHLYKDVRMTIYKNGQGANVNLYTPKQNPGRQAILRWLNDGTAERFSRPLDYGKSKKVISRKNYGANGGQSRGTIMGGAFWDVIYSHTDEAQQYVSDNIAALLVQAYNKQVAVENG